MIEESVIRDVISRVNLVQIVENYVQLRKRGRTLTGLCPFHAEKTPSFHVNADKNVYHCFGCGVGGNAIDFTMRIENLSFPEAVERLASSLGIEIKESGGGKSARKTSYETLDLAREFFRSEYCSAGGGEARRYAESRLLTDRMSKRFEIGYASSDWNALPIFLRSKGVNVDLAVKLGLLGKRDSGGTYGRFHERLMFPVHDERGRVVAFGGRTLEKGEVAKYINSPESDIYTKGEHLFGLWQSRQVIRSRGEAILVEGNVDAIMMQGQGFEHTVASMGTALTPAQAKLLSRYARRVYVMYDGDSAGRKATVRSMGILLRYPIEAMAAELPEGEDPDSFLRRYGEESMRQLIEASVPLSMWSINRVCDDILSKPVEMRKHVLGELGALLQSLNDAMLTRHFLEESARRLGMDPYYLAKAAGVSYNPSTRSGGKSGRGKFSAEEQRVADTNNSDANDVEWHLLKILLDSEERLKEFIESRGILLIEDRRIARLLETIAPMILETGIGSEAILAQLEDDTLKALLSKIICEDNSQLECNADDWYRGAVARLTEKWIEREIVSLGYELRNAINMKNGEEAEALMNRYKALQQLRIQTREERKINWESSVH